MIINQLEIQNFGKLHKKKMDFKEGINVVYGENESGKSTLHTFIQGIFFGIRRMRGRASKTDVYSRYEPWKREGDYAGTIHFTCGEKLFRLERTFQKENSREELICESDGERLSIEDGDLSVLLGNISEAIYDNTVSIGQLRSQTSEELVRELRNYMANYQGGMDGQIDIAQAIASLKEKKKGLEQQRKEEIEKQEQLQRELTSKMNYLEEEMQENLAELQESKEKLQSPLQQPLRQQEKTGISSYVWILPVLTLLILAAILWIPSIWGKALASVAVLLFGGLWIIWRSKQRKQKNANRQEFVKNRDRQSKLEWKLEHLQEEQQEQEVLLSNWKEEQEELQIQARQMTPLQEEIEAIVLAIETIETVSKKMQTQIGEELRTKTAKILAELTNGKYRQLSIDESFQMGFNTSERYVPMQQLSRGTIEQVYFALRMAVGDILCKEEKLPVLLDDVFAMYDEERLKETLRWLSIHKQQVILFTCHKREQELLDEMGITYHLQKMVAN